MKRAHISRWPAFVCALTALTVLQAAAPGDTGGFWPSWRGPLGTGVAPSSDPPAEWSETKNLRWKVELPGKGHATPVVWGDRIYVITAIRGDRPVAPAAPAAKEGGVESSAPPAPPGGQPGRRAPRPKPDTPHKFAVLALRRDTGKEVWRTVVREEVPHEAGHETASQASASPITDGEHIYAFFGSRGLYCLDMNGKVKWERDLGDMRTRNEFGEGASPVLHGDTIVVNWDHEGDSFIVALDKRTGEQRWRIPRDEPTSWSTPLILEDGGRALVVVSATRKVRAYDLGTGKEVWACGGLGANCIPTPVAASGLVFVMSGYQEAAGMAIRYPGASGDISGGERVAWRLDRGTSYVPSPLLYDDKLYFLDRLKAVVSCLDFKTGRPHYTEQRLEGLGNVYASPVGAAGRVYLLDRDGNGVVIRHGEKFEVLASNRLEDNFDASPIIAGDEIYLRGHRHLYCVAKAPS